MRDDAALRDEEAAVRLVDDLHLGRKSVGGKATRDLGAAEHLVPDVVLGARAKNARKDPLAALDYAGHVEELLGGLGLELAPQLVGASQTGGRSPDARSTPVG